MQIIDDIFRHHKNKITIDFYSFDSETASFLENRIISFLPNNPVVATRREIRIENLTEMNN